jgi:hypothetical protein
MHVPGHAVQTSVPVNPASQRHDDAPAALDADSGQGMHAYVPVVGLYVSAHAGTFVRQLFVCMHMMYVLSRACILIIS